MKPVIDTEAGKTSGHFPIFWRRIWGIVGSKFYSTNMYTKFSRHSSLSLLRSQADRCRCPFCAHHLLYLQYHAITKKVTKGLLFLSTLTCGFSIKTAVGYEDGCTGTLPPVIQIQSPEALSPWDYVSRLLSSSRSDASTRIMSSIFILSQWLQFSAVHDCIIYRPHLFSTFSILSNILPVQIRWRPKVSSSPVSYLANFCRKGRCGATQTVTFLLLFKKTKVFFILIMKSNASCR